MKQSNPDVALLYSKSETFDPGFEIERRQTSLPRTTHLARTATLQQCSVVIGGGDPERIGPGPRRQLWQTSLDGDW